MRRLILIILAIVVIVVIYFLATGRMNIDQTRNAEIPNISAEGGQLPAFDVDVNAAGIEAAADNAAATVSGAAEQAGEAVQNVNVPDVDVDVDANANNQ